MKTTLGRTIILVDDYDKAFHFYQQNFFCEKIFDAVTPDGQRFLHVKFSGDTSAGLWFLQADTAEQKSLVGKQTGGQPVLVMYTDDCQALYQHVQQNGVEIIEEITSMEGSTFFHCADLYGNRITVVTV